MPPDGTRPALRLVSANVCLAGSAAKLHRLLEWARTAPFDVFFFQEVSVSGGDGTLLQRVQQEVGVPEVWPGQLFFSEGTTRGEGCLVLLRSSPLLSEGVHVQVASGGGKVWGQGRVLRVDLECVGRPLSLVCVYAPADRQDRPAFYSETLPACLPAPDENRALVLGGDFNVVLDSLDRLPHTAFRAREPGLGELGALMTARGLGDVWRLTHPGARDVTWSTADGSSGARHDRWLLAHSLYEEWDPSSHIEPLRPVKSDHQPAALRLCPPTAPLLGKRPWRLQPAQLDLPPVKALVEAALTQAEALTARGGARWRWARFKSFLVESLKAHQVAEATQRLRELKQLRDEAAAARAALVAAHPAPAGLGQGRPAADPAAAGVAGARLRAALAAGDQPAAQARQHQGRQVLDHQYGETSSAYFHSLGRARRPRTAIRALQHPGLGAALDLSVPGEAAAARRVFEAHYSGEEAGGVYAHRQHDQDALADLLTGLPRTLSAAQATAAEGGDGSGRITLEELQRAVEGMATGKAPGPDGLPLELYKKFWPRMGPLLLAALDEAFDDDGPAPLQSFLLGAVTLVPKPGKPQDQVAGYRPITLLNCDVKLLSRVLSDRLQAPLDYLVSPSQSAFIGGRDIAHTTQLQLSVRDLLPQAGQQGWMVLADLAAAYDSCQWALLLDSMRAMGFKEGGHVRWARLLHEGAMLQVRVNGLPTAQFPVRAGLLQGSAVSPLYWCIVLEPLVARLARLASEAQGPRLLTPAVPPSVAPMPPRGWPTHLPPSAEHADDITAVLQQLGGEAEAALMGAFDSFRAAGGPALSVAKTCALALTPASQPEGQTALRVQPDGQSVRLLGVWVGNCPPEELQAATYRGKAQALCRAALPWRELNLSMVGRVHVATMHLQSRLVHALASVAPPAEVLARLQQGIRGFVGQTGRATEAGPWGMQSALLFPSEATCIMPVKEGGLGLPHLPTTATALRAKLIPQLFGVRQGIWQLLDRELLRDARYGMCTWAVTAPAAPVPTRYQCQRVLDHVAAFAATRPHRVVRPSEQGFWSAMAEPLVYNRQIKQPGGQGTLDVSTLASAQGRAWRWLRDVRAAWLSPQPSADVAADLALVLEALPEPWRAQVQCVAPPPPQWVCAVAGGGCWLLREAGEGGQPTHWVGPTGWGAPWATAPPGLAGVLRVPGLRWHPAAVVMLPVPDKRLTVEQLREKQQARGQRPELGPDGEPLEPYEPPTEPWLLGPWAELELDPTVWGYGHRARGGREGARDLVGFTVREARLRLLRMARARDDPGYSMAQGMWPALWGLRPPQPGGARGARGGAAAAAAPAAQPVYDSTGVAVVEAKWQASFDAALAAGGEGREGDGGDQLQPGERDAAQPPAWLIPARQRQRQQRPSPAVRAAVREQRQQAQRELREAAPDPVRPGLDLPDDTLDLCAPGSACPARAPWAQIAHTANSRTHRITAWRILHGSLMVGACRHHVRLCAQRPVPLEEACCPRPCCSAGSPAEPPPLDTLTHAFLECPAVQPALAWLLDVWERISGERPPAAPLVILAAAPWAWQPETLPSLWHRFRVAYLGCVWQQRAVLPTREGEVQASLARRVALAVQATLQLAVQRDWLRAGTDIRFLAPGVLPAHLFRGPDPALTEEQFGVRWPQRPAAPWYDVGAEPGVRLLLEGMVPLPQ